MIRGAVRANEEERRTGKAAGTASPSAFTDPDARVTPVNHVTLMPGELFCGTNPTVVTTVLGSCVAVTMLCRRLSLWAICHGVLPSGNEDDPPGCCRYVDESVRRMSAWFQRRGALKKEIEVKLFGGAEIMMERGPGSRFVPVGRSNVNMALSALESEGLRVATSDVGGYTGRKLRFHTLTGDVMVKRFRGQPE
jgi:chemotaxis protein CheD